MPIVSSNALWFFGLGKTPPPTFTQGNVQATLTLSGAAGGSFTWTVLNGTGKGSFASNISQTTVTTTTNAVILYSVSYSTALLDVAIQVAWTNSGQTVTQTINLTVDSPYRLALVGTIAPEGVDDCSMLGPGTNGWHSAYTWQMLSKFGQIIYGQSINENFANPQDAQQTNLTFSPNGSPGQNMVSTFTDNYCYANQIAGVPKPTVPQSPLGANLIDSATQYYSVGSTDVGSGVEVQSQLLSRYVDHASISNIISPVRSQ
jgi:hypothetical protein